MPGNRLTLLRSGNEYFPALEAAIDEARDEVAVETYIFADDVTGRRVAEALMRASARGVTVRVLIDGWGARLYLTKGLERRLADGGVCVLRYRPEVQPWHFRSHRLRRLHRKLAHVDGRVAFVGGINVIDDMNTPGHRPPRIDFAVRIEGPLLPHIVSTMQRVWALTELAQMRQATTPLFADERRAAHAGTQTAKFVVRDNVRNRKSIEWAYLAGIRTAREEIVIANAYFFPGFRFRHALIDAARRGVKVTLLLQARVEYVLLHFASRALYGQLLAAGVEIQEYRKSFLHAKVAVIDRRWATVGSSNIDPYSLLMAREANVFVRDRGLAGELHRELAAMVESGARRVAHHDWQRRSRLYKAAVWTAYGFVRLAMGVLGYGGNEWWRGARARRPSRA